MVGMLRVGWADLGAGSEAKAICAGCPARRQCLAFALRTHQVHGYGAA